jgi:uncharacterized protein (TIGR00661 family)
LQKKRILVCPLDWGLGHACRCIPIINALLQQGAEVVIAADERPLALLKQEFPTLEFVVYKGYNIQYPSSGSVVFSMLFQMPKLFKAISAEHFELEQIIEDHKIDAVISDNRFGSWSRKVPSVFITHQVMVKCPPVLHFMEPFIYRLNLKTIKKYTQCWIPDEQGKTSLSGDLANKYPLPKNALFIGSLSRFDNTKESKTIDEIDLLIILSGPEPQRSILEDKLLAQLENTNLKTLIVQGKPGNQSKVINNPNIKLVAHLGTVELQSAIINAKQILTRPGYTTIMDLAVLNKKAIFIPTPGQTEQEYLADYYKKQGLFYYESQSTFDLKRSLQQSKSYQGFASQKQSSTALTKTINSFLKLID